MDTSSNTPVDRELYEDLAVYYLLGLPGIRFTPDMLSPKSWSRVVSTQLGTCRPHLKYFDRMNEISFYLDRQWRADVARDRQRKVIFPDGFTVKTRVLEVATTLPCESTKLSFQRRALFVTESGQLLHCQMTKYATKQEDYDDEIRITWHPAKEVFFVHVDNEKFYQLLFETPTLVKDIGESLQKVVDAGIARREDQLEKLRYSRELLHRSAKLIER